MQVRIYFNLHKKKLSVQTKVNGQWRVTSHQFTAFLKNVRFKVSEAGRQRVINEKRKNVHAFVLGELLEEQPRGHFQAARYNPYQLEKFESNGEYIDTADFAVLNGRQLFVVNPK